MDPDNIFRLLPWDIKEMFVSYLSIIDIYNMSLIDDDFEYALKKSIGGVLDLSMDYRIDYKMVSNMLKCIGAETVVEINLSGLYWWGISDIRKILKRMVNLKNAYLIGTKFTKDVTARVNLSRHTNYYTFPAKVDVGEPIFSSMNFFDRQVLFFADKSTVRLNFVIDHSNWIDILMSPQDQFATMTDKDKIYIDMNVNEEEHFEKVCNENLHAREMIIDCGKGSRVKSMKLNLRILGSFKYLQRLRLELNTNAVFLDTIFSECKHLKFLRIVSHVPQFQLKHLQKAQSLEDLSFEINGTLNLDNLLTELGDNQRIKLRRIFLKFTNFVKIAKEKIINFLQANTQLIVFVIATNMTDTLMREMTKDIQPYCDSPQKLYFFTKFKSTDDLIRALHVTHFDLINVHVAIIDLANRN